MSSRLPSLVSIDVVAEHLGVEVRHVRRLVAERRIPYVKWGRLLRFDPAEVDEWINAARIDPSYPFARRRHRAG
jgi:excisionase family DNA binding protein